MPNQARKQLKLVFTGCVGAGKTTAIGAISEVPVVTTDARFSEPHYLPGKRTTTVALDYGALSLGQGVKLHLYGTPGQRRFDFMGEILTEGALGLVILIAHNHPDPLGELDYFVAANETFLRRDTAAVVGITHFQSEGRPSLQDFSACLASHGMDWPVRGVDARNKREVVDLVQVLLDQLD